MKTWADDLTALSLADALYVMGDEPPQVVYQRAQELLPPERHWLARWALIGQASGHEWSICDSCSEMQLAPRPTPSAPQTCLMTPSCSGRMHSVVPRPRLTNRIKRAFGMKGAQGEASSDRQPDEPADTD